MNSSKTDRDKDIRADRETNYIKHKIYETKDKDFNILNFSPQFVVHLILRLKPTGYRISL